MSRARRLYEPSPVSVEMGEDGLPARVDGVPVEALREEWVVEEGWWTSEPVRRRYFELILGDGRDVTLFLSLITGDWFAQRA